MYVNQFFSNLNKNGLNNICSFLSGYEQKMAKKSMALCLPYEWGCHRDGYYLAIVLPTPFYINVSKKHGHCFLINIIDNMQVRKHNGR